MTDNRDQPEVYLPPAGARAANIHVRNPTGELGKALLAAVRAGAARRAAAEPQPERRYLLIGPRDVTNACARERDLHPRSVTHVDTVNGLRGRDLRAYDVVQVMTRGDRLWPEGAEVYEYLQHLRARQGVPEPERPDAGDP